MKCILCGRRKGKRHCPAKNTLICAHCCGTKRVIEIDCPQDCAYLSSGGEYQELKRLDDQLRNSRDVDRNQRYLEALESWYEEIQTIEYEIAAYATEVSSLSDSDVLEAMKLLKKDYETETRGIIYEHRSSNPLAESLAKKLGQMIEEWRQAGEEDYDLDLDPPMRADHVVLCLDALLFDMDHQSTKDSSPRGYLRLVRRKHPEAAKAKSGAGLIQL